MSKPSSSQSLTTQPSTTQLAAGAIPPGSQLVLGTSNTKKCRELEPVFEPLGFRLRTLADFDSPLEVEETGTTFIENARLKASGQAQHLECWTIGEDSGLCVEALDGAPGVYSARYSGPDATDAKNNEKLLSALQDVPSHKRTAYYVSTIALSSPDGSIHIEASGRCYGRIIESYRGDGGFGYDPLFEIPEYHQTFAELGVTVKSVLSHRGRALREFMVAFRKLLAP